MRQITIHAGLNKAASTFLRQVFPALPDLNYSGKSLDLRSLSIDESRLPDAPALFSEESVVGVNIVSRSGDRHRDRERALEQLKSLFGDPRLVVVFRRHDEFLLSIYKQYLNLGEPPLWRAFCRPTGRRGFFSPDELRFRRIVEQIEERLETPQLYLDYADLKTAPEAFVAAIARFAGGSGAPSAPAVRGARAQRRSQQVAGRDAAGIEPSEPFAAGLGGRGAERPEHREGAGADPPQSHAAAPGEARAQGVLAVAGSARGDSRPLLGGLGIRSIQGGAERPCRGRVAAIDRLAAMSPGPA
jgi:hypothetical protein